MVKDIRQWAAEAPDRIALQIGTSALTYAELEALSNRLSRLIASMHLPRGSHVAAILPNKPLLVAMAWAAWRSGVYFTPISTVLSPSDAAHIVADSEARMLIGDSTLAASLTAIRAQVGDGVRWLASGGGVEGFESIEDQLASQADTPHAHESPGSLMMYTSGTTGLPKGVIRPLAAADYVGPPLFAIDLVTTFRLREGMRYLSTAPLYHAGPLGFVLGVTAMGGTVFAMEKFEPAQALSMLTEHRITHSQWVPTMFQRLLQLPMAQRNALAAPDHVVAWHAAAPCAPAIKRAMIDWWGPILVEYYGGSEGVGNTSLDSTQWLARPGSVGRAVKGLLHVVDDEGHDLPSGQVGRIYFSGVSLFEYFKDPQKTAARRHPLGYQAIGDIGYVDDEGYLFLTDRMDDMIISGGVNVYPQEIEAALFEMPEVADCGVVGVADARFGERPVAFIVGAAGLRPEALVDAVRSRCEQRLGRIKQPERYLVVPELPYSPTGKLLRRRLREMLLAAEV